MPEREFELYLSLLGRLLRLNVRQRDELTDEFRDHLESRLDELVSTGLSRDEATRQALEEFGDAAVLADCFTHLARRRTRRRIMRWTFGTISAAALVVFAALALMPETPNGPVPPAIAQSLAQIEKEAVENQTAPEQATTAQKQADAETEAKLDQRIAEVSFQSTPLKEVFAFIGTEIKADLIMDRWSLETHGISPDTPITLNIQHTPVTAARCSILCWNRWPINGWDWDTRAETA